MKKVNWLGNGIALLLFIAVPLAIGFTGSFLTGDQVDGWYASADQAPWTPPNAVFGPVWTLLYVMIGAAGWFALVLYSYAPETTSLYSLRHSADSQCCLEPDFFWHLSHLRCSGSMGGFSGYLSATAHRYGEH